VCSGIEAATEAWHPLGWEPLFFSEIEPFPRAYLKHHYPDVPLFGDFQAIRNNHLRRVCRDPIIDLLVGGTPCQSFSVAGLRKGLDDPRGNLTLAFVQLVRRTRPRWVVWENVPGVFSIDAGRAFASLLAGLTGRAVEPPNAGWKSAGIIPPADELSYGVMWRVLDAQYFGLAQRRKRVFLVGYLGDWRPPAAVLFEPEGMRGDPAPRREEGQGASPILEVGARTGSSTDDPRAGSGIGDPGEPMFTLQAGKNHGVAAPGNSVQDAMVPAVSPTLRAGGNNTGGDRPPGTDVDTCETLIPQHPVCMATGQGGAEVSDDVAGPTLTCNHEAPLAAIPFDTTQVTHPANHSSPKPGDPSHPLAAGAHAPAIAHSVCLGSDPIYGREFAMPQTTRNGDPGAVQRGMSVRRLTPRECERLQGFPDDYTLIPWRGRPAEDCPDGPRYRALGNSMAVPCMAWIGWRIDLLERLVSGGAV